MLVDFHRMHLLTHALALSANHSQFLMQEKARDIFNRGPRELWYVRVVRGRGEGLHKGEERKERVGGGEESPHSE